MDKELDKELDEAKATGEESYSADAVVGAGGAVKKRKADLSKAPGATQTGTPVVTPQGTNNTGLQEMIASLFGDTDLSEEFKQKTVTIFEAAVHEKVEAVRSELEEEFNLVLEEQTDAIVEELTAKLDSYLDYVVESWMKENEVALEVGYKVNVAESLFANLRNIMVEHNLEINEDEVDAIAAMEEQIEETNAKYNQLFEELVAVREEKSSLEKNAAFAYFTEGMVDTDVERFKVLAEGISYDSIDTYADKLETIKESYFGNSIARAEDQSEILEEEVETAKPSFKNQAVAAYVASLDKYGKN